MSKRTPWYLAATVAVSVTFGGVPAFADLPACIEPGQSPPCTILPSDTDGNDQNDPGEDCPGTGIGCDADTADQWGELAFNGEHFLYLPSSSEPTSQGKLLVFLCGGKGSASVCENVFPVAAQQGYHVIGLAYPADLGNCVKDLTSEQRRACFGDFMTETVTGACPHPDPSLSIGCQKSHISEHPQDSVVRRLIRVLQWADARGGDDEGWGRFLTADDDVEWSKVHLAGMSNGSSYASLMGTLFPSVRRVALFAGPNDGTGSTAQNWKPADYIQHVPGITDTHYYGLVHVLNNAESATDDVLYKVTNNWRMFEMGSPLNPSRKGFDPDPATTTMDFEGAHMLISTDPLPTATQPGTTPRDAHISVVRGKYCHVYDEVSGSCQTPEEDQEPIGYEPAWRCILGTGNACVSSPPVADAGPDQTVECSGGGGAVVGLDGSGSRDVDCDVLTYAWTGPFAQVSGSKPTVFAPLGSNTVTLEVEDPWSSSPSCPTSSAPDTTLITVTDTQPPSLQVTLTPTVLWSPDHRLVRIDATISVTDSCGDAPPQVVLSSIISDQRDNGVADGDTDDDIQDDAIGFLDQSFLVRAERAANDPNGRTYTVTYTATDGSGNKTQTSATVHVPLSQ
jgi:hypothetical protein